MSSNVRKQLENWLKTIDVNGTVLDVGGVVMPVKGRTKSWNVTDYKILDSSTEKRRVKTDYLEDINYEIIEDYPQFDVIFCLEVMEYVWNPAMALNNISKLLKPNGLLYISFHFLFPHHHPVIRDYLRYTISGINMLLKKTGFKMEEVVPRTTRVPDTLREFCQAESKVYKYPSEIGYLIKAKKYG